MTYLVTFAGILLLFDLAAAAAAVGSIHIYRFLRVRMPKAAAGAGTAVGAVIILLGVWIPLLGIWIVFRSFRPGGYGSPLNTLRRDPLYLRTMLVLAIADVTLIAIRLSELVLASRSPAAVIASVVLFFVLLAVLHFRRNGKGSAVAASRSSTKGAPSRKRRHARKRSAARR